MSPDETPGPRPRFHRWGMRLVGVVSCAVLATSGFGWAVVDHVNQGIDRVDAFQGIKEHERPVKEKDKGLNFLLVGVDGRDGLSRGELRHLHAGGTACNCTDSLMVLHVSGDRRRLSVVSLPRDSYVEFPDHDEPGGAKGVHHPGKINAAYAHGGPSLTVRTVEKATGIHIDHYLEVNFRTFVNTVDALGGVEVCTMTPLRDDYSGLDLPSGTTVLDGAGSLRYVRARHIGGSSDFGRIRRQQHFLAQVIGRLHSTGVLMNPARLTRVVDAVLSSVRADRELSSTDLVTLGTAMRRFAPSGSEFTQVPVADADYRGDPAWGSSVLWDRVRAEALFAKVRGDRPLARHHHRSRAKSVPIDPRGILVRVYNASGVPGEGVRAERQLSATGFATTGDPEAVAGPGVTRTVITYDPRWDRSARTLATALPGARLNPVAGHGPLMQVFIGSAFDRVTRVRAETRGVSENPDDAVTGDQVVCP
ncbi:LCP family protein [Wenjunlia tyrosinilytica]|uniref:LytR family transcriptional regulator n=1 Tax=Wenjunlia tyrosinilytica TaxID=1544741 RepID=A0A918DY22_9ACTN|nr:LCP family protein [Wenjunlia tyrosinilytica]GGO88125.1 LytR family transcriptional regulator [Wenjunlia tyrosinilytica]